MKLSYCAVLLLIVSALPAAAQNTADPQLAALLAEAMQNNPDLQAARREVLAARSKVSLRRGAGRPDARSGVLNYPVQSRSFKTEDMTMKMIGLAAPAVPGKRALRRDVADRKQPPWRRTSKSSQTRCGGK